MTGNTQLTHLIGVLYETALDTSRWPEAIGLCAHFAGGIAAHLLTFDKRIKQPILSVHGGEVMSYDNASYHPSIDPRITATMMTNIAVHEWRCCYDYMPQPSVNNTEFYQHFWIPDDLHYSMACWVDDDIEQQTLMGVFRSSDQAPFGTTEMLAAQCFGSHLQRALRLQKHHRSLIAISELTINATDVLALSMLIVDSTGFILHMNAGAEHWLNHHDSGLSFSGAGGGRLIAADPINKSKLASLIAKATSDTAECGAMFLSNGNTGQLFVTPFAGAEQSALALILLMGTDKNLSALAFLEKLYHLSPAELRLASALSAGNSPEEYAQESGVQLSTVRSHLKNLFIKTGTRRQGALVALLNRVPPLRG